LFKKRKMRSVPENEILYTLYSSATGGNSSRIYLDRETSRRQQILSANVLMEYIGKIRKPFLILDTDPQDSGSEEIKARSAATRGILPFASVTEYFMRSGSDKTELDMDKLWTRMKYYLKMNIPVSIFGFTYILYIYMIRHLISSGKRIALPGGSQIIHIGGWKKLADQSVTRTEFLDDIEEALGIPEKNIFDVYGFTEQLGLLYINRGSEPKTVPLYSELIIRDLNTLEVTENGKPGLIQILTPFPRSYPGISVLTGDIGRIVTGDARGGPGEETRFEVLGPSRENEIKGCGDVMADSM